MVTMNGRVFAALFVATFLAGALPMLLVQPTGAASAWLTVGFLLPVQNHFQIMLLLTIGLLASRMSSDPMLLLPVCAVLMLSIGAMLRIDPRPLPAMHGFIVGAIVLFALGVSMLRRGALLSVPPIAAWAYYAGGGYMAALPGEIMPLYFLIGALLSAALIIAIGVSLGLVLAGSLDHYMHRVRLLPKVAALMGFF